jgi:hypothetical protein
MTDTDIIKDGAESPRTWLISAKEILAAADKYRISIECDKLSLQLPNEGADAEPILFIVWYRIVARIRQIMNTPIFAQNMDENTRRRDVSRAIVDDCDAWLHDKRNMIMTMFSALQKIDESALIVAYNKYGYTDLLRGIRVRNINLLKAEFAPINHDVPSVRRYVGVDAAPSGDQLVYRMRAILESDIIHRELVTLTPQIISELTTIDMATDTARPYLRIIDQDSATIQADEAPHIFDDVNLRCGAFAEIYNNTLSAQIMQKLKRGSAITASTRKQNIGELMIAALDYYDIVDDWIAGDLTAMRESLKESIVRYLLIGFGALNTHVSEPKEVIYMNYSYIVRSANEIVNMTIHHLRESAPIDLKRDTTIPATERAEYVTRLRECVKQATQKNNISRPIESLETNIYI